MKKLFLLMLVFGNEAVFAQGGSGGYMPYPRPPSGNIYTRAAMARPDQLAEGDDLVTYIKGEQIKGVPFLVNEWVPGEIIMKDGRRYSSYDLVYDMFNQKVIFLNGKEPLEVDGDIQEFSVKINPVTSRKFINAVAYKKSVKEPHFLEEISAGKTGTLLRENKMVITTAQEKTNFRSFELWQEYFYYDIEKEKLTSLKKGNSARIADALKLSDEQKKQLNFDSFNFSREEDLKDFFKAYFSRL